MSDRPTTPTTIHPDDFDAIVSGEPDPPTPAAVEANRLYQQLLDDKQTTERPRLARTKQCAKCPWKVSTDPFDIPHGYDPDRHRALQGTIARPGALTLGGMLRFMACHEHPVGKEVPCIGWLAHQLGPGNNIGLRLWAMHVENMRDLTLDGEQHECFERTLP